MLQFVADTDARASQSGERLFRRTLCVAVCCSVLQLCALQCVAAMRVLQYVAVTCVLQCVAALCVAVLQIPLHVHLKAANAFLDVR